MRHEDKQVLDAPSIEQFQHLIQKLDATLQKTNERLDAIDVNQARLAEAITGLNISLTASPIAERAGLNDDRALTEEEEATLETLFDNLYESAQRWDNQLSHMNKNLDTLITEMRKPISAAEAKEQ